MVQGPHSLYKYSSLENITALCSIHTEQLVIVRSLTGFFDSVFGVTVPVSLTLSSLSTQLRLQPLSFYLYIFIFISVNVLDVSFVPSLALSIHLSVYQQEGKVLHCSYIGSGVPKTGNHSSQRFFTALFRKRCEDFQIY